MPSLRFSLFALLCLAMVAGVTGCATPARRAHDNAAAFTQLSPADQRLVLHGHVRRGLEHDAVVIAWGKPNDRYDAAAATGTKEKMSREVWVYRRQLVSSAPLGSYDQWQPGSSRAPLGTGLLYSPGFGFGGAGCESFLLYHPHVRYTDSYIRRAVFVGGKLENYEQWYGELPPLP